MKQANIRDIAKAAGTSPATVSRTLNNSLAVLPETRQRVIKALQKTGYRFGWGCKSRTIGILIGDSPFVDPYQSEMLTELNKVFSEAACRLEIISARDLDLLNERVIAGAIGLLCSFSLEKRWAAQTALPLVRINGPGLKNSNVRSVGGDGYAAAKLCIERLWRAGHRRIAFLSDLSPRGEMNLFTRRYKGFLDELRKRGIPSPELYAALEGSRDGIKRVLEAGCTAGICVNGAYGPKAAKTLLQLGRRIPEDFSLISWEYPGISEFMSPAHTTCAPDYREMARQAFSLLMDMIEGKDCPEQRLVPFKMIERESVAAPKTPVAKIHCKSLQARIVKALKKGPRTRKELAEELGVSTGNGNFLRQVIALRKTGAVHFTIPKKPRSKEQKLALG